MLCPKTYFITVHLVSNINDASQMINTYNRTLMLKAKHSVQEDFFQTAVKRCLRYVPQLYPLNSTPKHSRHYSH